MHSIFNTDSVSLICKEWSLGDPLTPVRAALTEIYAFVQAFHNGSRLEVIAMSVDMFLWAAKKHHIRYEMSEILSWSNEMINN